MAVDSAGDILRVLVVDDEEAMRTLLTTAIVREGHQVVAVESAEEALSRLPEWQFDAAFVDRRLPGIDGLVLGQYLRRAHPQMAVALVTGDDAKRTVKQTKKLDITFIGKPFNLSAILDVLEEARESRAARRAHLRDEASESYVVELGPWSAGLADLFSLPSVSRRTEDALVERLKQLMHSLRHERDLDEGERVSAYAGLVAALVLGSQLPHTPDGRTMFEEFDEIMTKHGKRTEFSIASPPKSDPEPE
ncbi:MAG: response regulator [Polyangiaceae bacterium]